ncbi:D123-domain-containing protein [Desarmillaria tabescens]|uniref:D123-domain-containing protein n=1 Tax=Armillaria tabescens TaxID=1929756 RepID=A0AA39TQH7_ARMTA|nr:D123-domain-containing protein [Desarmillaria tabescens]KAK0466977.1 D123-domain-containing protein [Desarmillaria tabescens]
MTALPPLSAAYILSFQFSSWYPRFSSKTIKSTIIRRLPPDFVEYLDSDGVIVPEGSENLESTTVVEDESDDEAGEPEKRYSFPDLDAEIRQCIAEYGAVFPKLNFSSPKDASWILPAGSPLKCTSPSDIYLLLKSSDSTNHDLSKDHVFEGCERHPESYGLELVLRKWYSIDRSRECRCFVRKNSLIGISQRDLNYYDFWNDSTTQKKITKVIKEFWETEVQPKWDLCEDYVFDFLLTRDLSRGHIIDFSPYAVRTDPLLFSYEELWDVYTSGGHPVLRVIDSRAHPAANTNAPIHQHNMIPFEAFSLSSGRDIDEFSQVWQEELNKSMQDQE